MKAVRSARARIFEFFIEKAIFMAGIISIVFVILIFIFLVKEMTAFLMGNR